MKCFSKFEQNRFINKKVMGISIKNIETESESEIETESDIF